MLLFLIILLPLVGAGWVMLVPANEPARVRNVALGVSVLTFILTIFAVSATVTHPEGGYRLEASVPWLRGTSLDGTGVDVQFRVGVDGISVWLLALTAFLTPLAIWGSYSGIRENLRAYYALMLLLHSGMLGVFCAVDLLLFYIFFEFTLVPLYFLIGIWGGPERREAANKFFIYTLAGSVLTFAGVLYLGYLAFAHTGVFTLSIPELTRLGQSGAIPVNVQWYLFLALAAGFAIKVPFFPVHTWLPLAHTEAPTAGSVILAGVLLKLGTYGFCRLSLPVLPEATRMLAPFMATLAIIGIIYGALAAWVQQDVKKLVAYSSVSHLGFCMLGMMSLTVAGVTGSVLYMINHGLSTGALFLLVGMFYERYHTREVDKIGGLARTMPWLAFFLIFFTLCSIGLPGTNGFISEFMVLLGTTISSEVEGGRAGPLGFKYTVWAALGIILGAIYMLWMCRRVLFGPLKEPPHTPDTSSGLSVDLTPREISILTPIALACLTLGIYPKIVLDPLHSAVATQILHVEQNGGRLASSVNNIEVPSSASNGSRRGLSQLAGGEAQRNRRNEIVDDLAPDGAHAPHNEDGAFIASNFSSASQPSTPRSPHPGREGSWILQPGVPSAVGGLHPRLPALAPSGQCAVRAEFQPEGNDS